MPVSPALIQERLAAARAVMADKGFDALIVPSSDPHLSEYLPLRWSGREWLSGFTGSMGTLVVMAGKAALFADSRYWVQAEYELRGTGIDLVKIPTGSGQHLGEWLAVEVPPGGCVVVDGQVMGVGAARSLQTLLAAAGVQLQTQVDIIEAIWTDRPGLPEGAIEEHLPPYAPVNRSLKLQWVREIMAKHGMTHHLLSTLDDIAWLLNLRGQDVEYNPVFIAHALVSLQDVRLYLGEGKVDAALQAKLKEDGIHLASYDAIHADLGALSADNSLLVDPARVTLGIRQSVALGVPVVESINPSTLFKSRKSEQEAQHIRAAMEEDGKAMCEFYTRFEAALQDPQWQGRLTELTVDEWLTEERAKRPGFRGLSFNTIAGFNANGALPHYRATPEHHATIDPVQGGLLLIDSGGQYLGGTTDITRVWAIGQIGPEHRQACTLVLKGMIALSQTEYPQGTLSPMLDAIARAPLWAKGLDYRHGTGHGVGYFLNVHEGPQSLSKAVPTPHMAMEAGMVTSIEPGLYHEGRFGVRIENLVLNVVTHAQSEYGPFLAFETLTLCPIDTQCLDIDELTASERQWLNQYHATVRQRLSGGLSAAAQAWLDARTQPV